MRRQLESENGCESAAKKQDPFNPLIIIPTYNERENIEMLLPQIMSLVPAASVVVIDDNSQDGTAEVVRQAASHYNTRIHLIERPQKMGLGSAYLEGFNYALARDFDPIFQMDADLSHNPESLEPMLAAVATSDMVCGSRYLAGVSVVNWPLWRLLLSYCANRYARLVTGVKLTDITTGYTCIRRHVLSKLDLGIIRSEGYSFQIELKFYIHKAGFTITEIPIIFVDRRMGHSKLSRNIITEALGLVVRLRLGIKGTGRHER